MIPKLVVMAAIAAVLLTLYLKARPMFEPRQPGVIYVNPNIGGN